MLWRGNGTNTDHSKRTVLFVVSRSLRRRLHCLGPTHHYSRFPKRVLYFHAFVISAEPHVISISLHKQTKIYIFFFLFNQRKNNREIQIRILWFVCCFASLASPVVLWPSYNILVHTWEHKWEINLRSITSKRAQRTHDIKSHFHMFCFGKISNEVKQNENGKKTTKRRTKKLFS